MSILVPDAAGLNGDVPRSIRRAPTTGDRIFRLLGSATGMVSFAVVGLTAVFLFWYARPALDAAGWWRFFVTTIWNPSTGKFGVAGLLVGTILIAAVALVVALPISLATAIFINEYAPDRLKRWLISLVDLLAALPSLVFGIWGLFALMPHLEGPARWLTTYFSSIPIFQLSSKQALLAQSTFVAGCVVGIMIIPIITSVSREVMSQVPRDQCEGALALGGSRWGMVRNVILPFGRSGIVGATLLGFGRALGETIAVALVLSLVFPIQPRILEAGGGSIAALIATQFGEANELARSGLVAAGLSLFIVTLVVNMFARRVVKRAALRSGANIGR